jgi:hypothetical protein
MLRKFFFQKVCRLCRKLVQTLKSTRAKDYGFDAKVKVKGDKNGFKDYLPSVQE